MSHFFKRSTKQAVSPKELSSAILHELRTPLSSIKSAVSALNEFLPQLLEGYRLAEQHHLPVSEIQPRHLQSLDSATKNIQDDLNFMSCYLNMIVMHHADLAQYLTDLGMHSFKATLAHAMSNYPYRSKGQQDRLILKNKHDDFLYYGNAMLIEHVLLNLINLLCDLIIANPSIQAEITINTEELVNTVNFTLINTSNPAIANYIDTSSEFAFCQRAMQALKCAIIYHNSDNNQIQFVLKFPFKE